MYGGGHRNRHAIRIRESCKCAVRWRVQAKQLVTRETGVGQSSIPYAGLLGVLALQQPKVSILLGHRALGCVGMRSDS